MTLDESSIERRLSSRAVRDSDTSPTPLLPVLVLTALTSIGTGVIWHGVAFIAETQHGYSKPQTNLIYLVMGAVYAIGALRAGVTVRALRRRMSPRQILFACLIVQSAVSFTPLLFDDAGVLWLVAIITAALSSIFWPLVESYLTAGRHGHTMRSAIGVWNLVWTTSVAGSMLLMAPMLEHRASDSIVMLGVCNALALLCLPWFSRSPASHDHEENSSSVSPVYPSLLTAFRTLLLLSYVVTEALTPLLPFLLTDLLKDGRDTFTVFGLESSWRTIIAATWMISRTVAMALMWRLRFWHGSWTTLHVGGGAVAVGFALTIASPSLGIAIFGLAILGVGVGVIYYAALYYAMSVGMAEVDAGGKHEAMIGIGYALGPAAGLVGIFIADSTGISQATAVIGVVWLILLIGGGIAWRATRHRRILP